MIEQMTLTLTWPLLIGFGACIGYAIGAVRTYRMFANGRVKRHVADGRLAEWTEEELLEAIARKHQD